MSLPLTLLVIFLARCADVSMGVFRILLVVKGKKILAALLGFFEVMVFISVMNIIMGGGKSLSLPELLAYCGGFAAGNIVGSFLESKLMDAYVVAEIIAEEGPDAHKLVDELRNAGLGTTVIHGEGRGGPRLVMKVICSRKHLDKVKRLSEDYGGFLYIADIRGVSGGFFTGVKRK